MVPTPATPPRSTRAGSTARRAAPAPRRGWRSCARAAADVVVVGGGVIGAACAYELAGRGARVVVLERGGGWGEGCSWGNAGLIVPSHARPIAAPESLRAGLGWMVKRESPFGLKLKPSLAPW